MKREDKREKEGERSPIHGRGRANWIATYISIQQMKIDFDAVPLITSARAAPHCRRHLMNARTPKPVKRRSVFVILEKSG